MENYQVLENVISSHTVFCLDFVFHHKDNFYTSNETITSSDIEKGSL